MTSQAPEGARSYPPRGGYRDVVARRRSGPITIALVDDYDVVLVGVAHMFDHYRDRVVVAEIDANKPISDDVDIVLYDSFAQPESDHDQIQVLIDNPHAQRVAVYTWNFHPAHRQRDQQGASGYLSKRDRLGARRAPLKTSTPVTG